MGRISGKSSFWTWILRQATRQNFTLISSPTFFYKYCSSCNAFFWISKLVGEALKSDFLFLFSRQKFTIRRKRRRWARKFLASGPWIHPTNDTRRYGAKEAYPRLGSLAARQTFFQAVDRLPHPRVRWLAS